MPTMSSRHWRTVAGLPALALVLAMSMVSHRGADAGMEVLACSPERLAVAPGESVTLRAWLDPAADAEPVARYAWDARVGHLEGTGAEVQWRLSDVSPGRYAASVQAHSRRGAITEECIVRVIVRREAGGRGPLFPTPGAPSPTPSPPPAPSRESGSAFLLSDQAEAPGYGLYSYLLFGSPPSESARDRYLKALEAYVGLIPDIASLGQYVASAELNIVYVPLRATPDRQAVAESMLAHYDYARARSILRLFPAGNRNGPYIVSSRRPLGGPHAAAGLSTPYLFQDLSNVPPHLVASWVKEFLNQAAQERFWEDRSGERFALKLRVTVGVLAAAMPEVKKALDTWIAWVR